MCWCNKSINEFTSLEKTHARKSVSAKILVIGHYPMVSRNQVFKKHNDGNGQKLTLPGSEYLCSSPAPIFSSYNQLMWHQVGSQDCNQKSERCFFKKSRWWTRIATIVARRASRMIQTFTDQIKLMLLIFIKHASVAGYHCLWQCVAS